MSDAELLPHLDRTDTVAIVTTRRDGTEVATPIWAVVVGDAVYARSAYGPQGAWYRRARSGRPVAFSLADGARAERDAVAALEDPRATVSVEDVPVDAAVQAEIDAAVRTKYGRSPVVNSMFAPQTVATTLRFRAV